MGFGLGLGLALTLDLDLDLDLGIVGNSISILFSKALMWDSKLSSSFSISSISFSNKPF
jgi:hypothetical protein